MEKNNEFAWLASQAEVGNERKNIVISNTKDLTVEEFVNALLEVMKKNPEVNDFKISGISGKSLEYFYKALIVFKQKTLFLELS
jgi:hypothetical protein